MCVSPWTRSKHQPCWSVYKGCVSMLFVTARCSCPFFFFFVSASVCVVVYLLVIRHRAATSLRVCTYTAYLLRSFYPEAVSLSLFSPRTAAVFIDLSSIKPFKGYGWLFFSSHQQIPRVEQESRWSCWRALCIFYLCAIQLHGGSKLLQTHHVPSLAFERGKIAIYQAMSCIVGSVGFRFFEFESCQDVSASGHYRIFWSLSLNSVPVEVQRPLRVLKHPPLVTQLLDLQNISYLGEPNSLH